MVDSEHPASPDHRQYKCIEEKEILLAHISEFELVRFLCIWTGRVGRQHRGILERIVVLVDP